MNPVGKPAFTVPHCHPSAMEIEDHRELLDPVIIVALRQVNIEKAGLSLDTLVRESELDHVDALQRD